jgi:serine/threonine-protein phosphatase 2A regulatory subunit B'
LDPKSDPDEEQIMLEESWPHIQLVYEILLRLVICPQLGVKAAKEFLTTKLIRNLFELMKSPDPRERDYLKTIIHRIYSKYMIYRSYIRKLMSYHLLESIHESSLSELSVSDLNGPSGLGYSSNSWYGISEIL